ncbi:MAG: pantothenate kinase [Oscillatoria sp. SIO1A7]|nr:pantothenate kinase [Oscillatoria sp. SIO1A7]
MPPHENIWLALAIGNSRLHWALFCDRILQVSWDTPHLNPIAAKELMDGGLSEHPNLSPNLSSNLWQSLWQSLSPNLWPKEATATLLNTKVLPPLWIASVVPEQLQLWLAYPRARAIALEDLPLSGLYPTLGIDRALAVLGAGTKLGWPVLVIDAGTALTFTGADRDRRLVGGAILPGLALQLASLSRRTAALPAIELPDRLPERWAATTPAAMSSGVIYTVLAGMRDFIAAWQDRFPASPVALTGGDSCKLKAYLQSLEPALAEVAIADPNLIFWGIQYLAMG